MPALVHQMHQRNQSTGQYDGFVPSWHLGRPLWGNMMLRPFAALMIACALPGCAYHSLTVPVPNRGDLTP